MTLTLPNILALAEELQGAQRMQNHEPRVLRSQADLWEPLCTRGFCQESEC